MLRSSGMLRILIGLAVSETRERTYGQSCPVCTQLLQGPYITCLHSFRESPGPGSLPHVLSPAPRQIQLIPLIWIFLRTSGSLLISGSRWSTLTTGEDFYFGVQTPSGSSPGCILPEPGPFQSVTLKMELEAGCSEPQQEGDGEAGRRRDRLGRLGCPSVVPTSGSIGTPPGFLRGDPG
ncbi:unnamed protein product [Gadus morhua 'NCC']